MAGNQNQRRQMLSANLKSAITTAAIVGVLGGWAAFGTQQPAVTTATQAVAQVADSATTAQSSTGSQTTAQSSTSSQSSAQSAPSTWGRPAVATTRSSR